MRQWEAVGIPERQRLRMVRTVALGYLTSDGQTFLEMARELSKEEHVTLHDSLDALSRELRKLAGASDCDE